MINISLREKGEGQLEGIIVKAISGFFYVKTDGHIYRCKARGRFKKENLTPLVGDWVIFYLINGKEGVIEEILPRQSQLVRPAIVNVQQAVFLFSVKDPPANLMLLDRLLVIAESNRLDCVICFNKIDLVKEEEVIPLTDIYKSIGYQVILTSALKGTGIDQVRNCLKDKMSVIAGPSGSGKSALLNRVEKGLGLKVGPISAKTRRGKQTTRHVELLTLSFGGLVADSPGFSQVDFLDFSKEELPYYFPEIAREGEKCKFKGCLHEQEPFCNVKEGVNRGEIALSRYQNYLNFLKEIKERERRY
ncbi:MAG: ribosome small subunit-dependent GTPase A [Candidatus Syntrophonatronum acetioxidans]|uniref:Small ribosomal subunit biogenesis GTPase RsgA n=1 Tax=Candidatus Syntrophonatronum acetioxidans TaxID=1795816 RepID=A0A424YHU9_9FIRM|nr:MAG: ribosome small subunit-dependent GTPase A [Candidatus Syntrophonatronum acetioxidans]